MSDFPRAGDELARRYDDLAARWLRTNAIEEERARTARQEACPHDQGTKTFANRIRSGRLQAWRGCADCGANLENRWIKHDQVDLANVTILRDDTVENPPCRVCGAFGTELHHWAPKEFFRDEADHWPTDWLCESCHTLWHQRINAGANQGRLTS